MKCPICGDEYPSIIKECPYCKVEDNRDLNEILTDKDKEVIGQIRDYQWKRVKDFKFERYKDFIINCIFVLASMFAIGLLIDLFL